MQFLTLEYAVFLSAIFTLYWGPLRRSRSGQNMLLLFASYLFYAWWDWRFLSLILISSAVDYFAALGIERDRGGKSKQILSVSIAVNLLILGVFKYYNFFADSLSASFTTLGMSAQFDTLHIVLPVAVSFYTFQTMSYTIDVYYRRIHATRDTLSYFTYVAFFPQLVAGPIERASSLIPQFQLPRAFQYDEVSAGLRRILWGLFKKVAIADQLAGYADKAFTGYAEISSLSVLIGVIAFSFQIYCDFSAYSDIAIGSAGLFGIRLRENFRNPYFAASLKDFWKRWHISLSTWFQDYVYIPLGGNRVSDARRYLNLILTFLLSGLWHGASWTFLIWGALHGFAYSTVEAFSKWKSRWPGKYSFPVISKVVSLAGTSLFIILSWIPFRSDSLSHSGAILAKIFSWNNASATEGKMVFVYILLLLTFEWPTRNVAFPLQSLRWTLPMKFALYAILAVFILAYVAKPRTFIYFQF